MEIEDKLIEKAYEGYFPLTFQFVNIPKLSVEVPNEIDSKTDIEITFYQTNFFSPYSFYKPISKIISLSV